MDERPEPNFSCLILQGGREETLVLVLKKGEGMQKPLHCGRLIRTGQFSAKRGEGRQTRSQTPGQNEKKREGEVRDLLLVW